MLNFLGLSLTPTALIGLNSDLKVPKSFKIISNAKPSTFKYPDFLKKDENKQGEKVATAVLSTTIKVKARNERKNKAEGGGDQPMLIESPSQNEESKDIDKDKEMTDEEKKDKEKVKEEKEVEPET